MKFDFSDKNILITGGTRGIGAEIAKAFLQLGGKVTVTGRSENFKVPESLSSFEDTLQYFQADFMSDSDTLNLTKHIESKGYDVLINNAGINKIALVENISDEDWLSINKVNLQTPFQLTRAAVPNMKAKGWGRIVNISSIFGLISKSMRSSYSMSKSGLNGLTRASSLDCAQHGVLINSLSPGFIDTELTRTILSEAEITELTNQVPMKRLGSVEDIAKTTLFLCSNHNNFITGQNIVVDGGFTCV